MRQPKSITIRNHTLQADYEPATGTLTLVDRATRRAFVVGATVGGDATPQVKRVAANDAVLGAGEALEIADSSGRKDTITLYRTLPFAILRATLHNRDAAVRTVERIVTASLPIDLGKPAAELVALGTGGLHPAASAPGSYVWMATADPKTRNGVVCGWLTNHRGSGVLLPGTRGDRPALTAQIDYGKLRIEPGSAVALETLAIGYFDDARLGLEAWADTVARIEGVHLRPQPSGYCTWYHAGASNEKQLAAQAEFAAQRLAPFGFSFLQIDDGWQDGVSHNGPNRVFSRHRPDGPYPSGMKAAADHIRALGLTAGIWFMPFAGTYYDPFFADKQDWFVHREDGSPYETDWGGACLDMTNPAAREYLRQNVVRFAHEWGYHYFKMDGLWTGSATKQIYVNDAYRPDGIGDAVFHDPSKTNIDAYRSGLKLVREAAGPDVFLLGCCIPQNMRSYGAAFGRVDAMRIGPDNGPDWNGIVTGPTFGSRHYFLNGRVWWNDPDPVYVRPSVPIEQARLICSWAALTGQMVVCSDYLPDLPAERLDLLKRVMPHHGLLPRPVDLFEEPIPRVWILTDDRKGRPRRDIVGLFNWSDREARIDLPFERLGLDGGQEYAAFDYWGNRLLPSMRANLAVSVPKQSCVVLALHPTADHPYVISTNRHVTQGVVDILTETWDAGAQTLSGRSKVVAGDPYELRIVSGRPVASGQVSPADRKAGVTIETRTDGDLVRVLIQSPASRAVNWSLRLRP